LHDRSKAPPNLFSGSLLLSFRTLSIVRISTNQKTQRFGNGICFRPPAGGGTYSTKNQKLVFPQAMFWHRLWKGKPEDVNRSSFRNVVFSGLWKSGRWTKSRSLVVMSVTHHRQNPLECTFFWLLTKNRVLTWTAQSSVTSFSVLNVSDVSEE
jgi:hypothetical protein